MEIINLNNMIWLLLIICIVITLSFFENLMMMFGMICEWRAHNLLWSLGIKRERTKTVDLELKVKWYYKIGYFILSFCYLRW